MFCCLSPHANRSLNERDLKVMRVFADIVGRQIVKRIEAERKRDAKRARIERFISEKEFTFAYQPIWEFGSRKVIGFEALCRFTAEPYRSPDKWFGEAFETGCGVRLEVAVLEKALEALAALPDDVYLSINACPRTILDGGLTRLLEGVALNRVVLEITEHARVDDYPGLVAGLAPLRAGGVRLAIDDAGAGYASLQHIIQLRPDIIKLDMSLTRGVDADPARRALAMALIFFAQQTDAVIVAEGVETQNELDTLQLLGARRGQGYYLGRPTDLHAALALLDARATRKSA
jgi:EAL domain-containing protein (putative c-di-GMP-specific phosphodiesterase class I)